MTKKSIKRLVEKHGEEFLADFNDLKKKQFWNLVDIGNKYGFSREYARQIYKSLYNKPYRPIRTKKTKKIKDISCVHDPRRKYADYKENNSAVWKSAKTESMFFNECEKRGFKLEILCRKSIDIKINTYLIDVKSCFKPRLYHPESKTRYLVFHLSKHQLKNADFIACYHSVEEVFFIVPIGDVGSVNIYILESKSHHYNAKNRYWEFKDAWHLLEKEKNFEKRLDITF